MPPLRSSIRPDLSLDLPVSRPDSIMLANVGEDFEDRDREVGGDGVEEGLDRFGCTGGGGRRWERIELLELASTWW